MFKKNIVLLIGLYLFVTAITAQNDTVRYDIVLSGLAAKGDYAPFWMHNRQYAKVSASPQSVGLQLGASKSFHHQNKWFDYSFGVSGLVRNNGDSTDLYFHEIYAQARVLIFDAIIGSKEEQTGVEDASLSSGGFLFSRNARPLPRVTVGMLNYQPIPFTKGYAEIRGALSQGWFRDDMAIADVLLHHKYAYFRFGGKLPVHLQYGFEHVAQWGGESQNAQIGNQPTGIKNFIDIFLGRSGGSDATLSDQINTLGNHIIGQSLRLDIQLSDYEWGMYWQIINEEPPIRKIGDTMNTPDGLWGVSLRNKNFPFVKGILYEYMNSTDQSGPFHDRDGIVYGGNDSYFLGQYPAGWSYYSRTIGTPLITSPLYNKDGKIYTTNNRVQAHHFGIEGDVYGFNYRMLATFSKNYGNTSVYLSESLLKRNTSLMLEMNKKVERLWNTELGCTLGMDKGDLFGNNYGVQLSVRKTGDLFHW